MRKEAPAGPTPAGRTGIGGEMTALVEDFDWASTRLGPRARWPQSLKTTVELILASPVPIVMLWGPDGIMIYNDAYSVFAGGRHPRLLGSPVLEGWPEVADFNRRVMAVGLGGGTLSFRDQHLILYRNGMPEDVWMDLSYSPIRDEAGRPAGVLAIVVETTERVLAEQRQRQAEEALRLLNRTLEQRVAERTADRDRMWRLSTDIMLVARFDATITAVNPAWAALLGWSEDELLGTHFLDLVHPDDRAATEREVGRLEHGLTTLRFENRYRHKDGSYRWLSWTAVPDERFIHAVGRDMTAEKEAAAELERTQEALRQAQRMEAVGQLTGGIAHDFNNLLQALSACLNMVGRRTAADPSLRPILEAGQQAVDRGAKLTQQLMTFARRQSLRPEPFDVRDRLLGMSGLIERALRADIEVRIEIGAGLWPIEADPTQSELAILNLAVNARDAMPGPGKLGISAANTPLVEDGPERLTGDFVQVQVADTGTGMTPEVLARVFEPFFTTKEVGKGLGLGLSQVYGFCRQSGGAVRIDSRPGRGTTVTLILPRAAGAGGKRAERSSADRLVTRGARVLMVEDDPLVTSTVVAALGELGYVVAHAATGDEALARLRAGETLDLLFTDVVMPGSVSGIDLAREAGRLRPGLPVVLATGYSEDVAGAAGLRVLPKPYRVEDLAAAIEAELARAPLRMQAGSGTARPRPQSE